jgi:hypothetical protein
MHAGSAPRDEPPDGRVRPQGEEQLHPRVADAKGRRLDTLVGDDRSVLDGGAEELRVRLDRAVEILDRDPEMVDA